MRGHHCRRMRNPYGEGGRLREDLIRAADRLLAMTGDEAGLSLRAIAREVGIAAPSIYLHFADKGELVREVLGARFEQLGEVLREAAAGAEEPGERLRKACLAYCRFGLEHPNAYRVLFGKIAPLADASSGNAGPGKETFLLLVNGIRECMQRGLIPEGDPTRVAVNVWTALHGIVSLRSSAATFPWPPVAEQVDDVLAGLAGLKPKRATQPV